MIMRLNLCNDLIKDFILIAKSTCDGVIDRRYTFKDFKFTFEIQNTWITESLFEIPFYWYTRGCTKAEGVIALEVPNSF